MWKGLSKRRRKAAVLLILSLLAAIAAYLTGFPCRNTAPATLARAVEASFAQIGGDDAAELRVTDTVRRGRELAVIFTKGEIQGDVVLYQGLLGGWRSVRCQWVDSLEVLCVQFLGAGGERVALAHCVSPPEEAAVYSVTDFWAAPANGRKAEVPEGRLLEIYGPAVSEDLIGHFYDREGRLVGEDAAHSSSGGGGSWEETEPVYIWCELFLTVGILGFWLLWRQKPKKA